MKSLICVFTLLTLSFICYSQTEIEKLTKPIVDEGKRLYKTEMASWYGTDLFLEKYKERNKIGGYLSYTENEMSKCIFFSNADTPKVIGTISFDSKYDLKTAITDLSERELNKNEYGLYKIRQAAFSIAQEDTLFKSYKNTNLNFIPLISNGEKKVYILTGPLKRGVVIFGNDYLLTFDNDNNLLLKKQLHRNIIPINYGDKEDEEKEIEGAAHVHLPETGDFITATDICTLMLYEKFTKWRQHIVISEKYMSIWDCKTDKLFAITKEAMDKIYKTEEDKKPN